MPWPESISVEISRVETGKGACRTQSIWLVFQGKNLNCGSPLFSSSEMKVREHIRSPKTLGHPLFQNHLANTILAKYNASSKADKNEIVNYFQIILRFQPRLLQSILEKCH